MKIGILTYHRSHNYGALLQAIALRYQLIKMGHEVYFIDYWPKYHQNMYAVYSIKYALSLGKKEALKYTIQCMRYFKKRRERIVSFIHFINQNIVPYCKPYSHKDKYDLIVYGSDQIWRKQPGLSNKFNPVYFAENLLQAKLQISYAASMGMTTLKVDDYRSLKETIRNFTDISVREEEVQNILKSINVKSTVVLDPTFLLTKHDWDSLFVIERIIEGDYMLYYRLLEGSFDENAIRKIAKQNGCKLIILDGDVRDSGKENVISTANPLTFLSLIKFAKFIFTSSYHGIAFALIYHKQFYAAFISNAGRAKSLLNGIGLQDRLLLPQMAKLYNSCDIDYDKVEVILDMKRKESREFLLNNFKVCDECDINRLNISK